VNLQTKIKLNQDLVSITIFFFLGAIWGSNFIYMKLSTGFISPLQVVFFRVLFGFVPVLIYSLITRSLAFRHLKHSFHFMAMAMFTTVLNYYFFVKGTALLLSGIAGALSGMVPVFSFLFAVIFISDEKINLMKLVGVLLSFLGVLILSKPWTFNLAITNITGVFYIIAGSLSMAASFVYAKKYVIPLKIPTAAITTYQLAIGLVILSAFTDYSNITNIFQNTNAMYGLIIGLGLLGTGIAYLIYYNLVDRLGAVTASSVSTVPPVVALFIGAFLVGEQIVASDYFAMLLIIAGIFLLKKNTKTQKK